LKIEARLIEYGKSLLFPRAESFMPAQNPLKRVQDYWDGAGASGDEFHYDMVTTTERDGEAPGCATTTPCRPDGGLADMVERMAGAISEGRRCDEMREALREMPRPYFQIIQSTYMGTNWRDIPRRQTDAAAMLKIPLTTYRYRRERTFAWLESRLCIFPRRAA